MCAPVQYSFETADVAPPRCDGAHARRVALVQALRFKSMRSSAQHRSLQRGISRAALPLSSSAGNTQACQWLSALQPPLFDVKVHGSSCVLTMRGGGASPPPLTAGAHWLPRRITARQLLQRSHLIWCTSLQSDRPLLLARAAAPLLIAAAVVRCCIPFSFTGGAADKLGGRGLHLLGLGVAQGQPASDSLSATR
eukprot:TRINITY_DN14834_c0_g2_i1.p1 TRINITY_DN14834_c0_g2~~TRINITY_DN14834_c0_g2_i1.p1  ORF type:complete len:195 (+),score=9.83 TRINITY_DN14834_c0_g2_i1:313-897(+)